MMPFPSSGFCGGVYLCDQLIGCRPIAWVQSFSGCVSFLVAGLMMECGRIVREHAEGVSLCAQVVDNTG